MYSTLLHCYTVCSRLRCSTLLHCVLYAALRCSTCSSTVPASHHPAHRNNPSVPVTSRHESPERPTQAKKEDLATSISSLPVEARPRVRLGRRKVHRSCTLDEQLLSSRGGQLQRENSKHPVFVCSDVGYTAVVHSTNNHFQVVEEEVADVSYLCDSGLI